MKSLNNVRIYLFVCTIFAALCARADIVEIDFTSTVTTARGNVPPGAGLGSVITGHLQIDLATLPTPVLAGDYVGNYSYLSRNPGYTFEFTVGQDTLRYDSINASQEGGFTPGISLQHGPQYDALTFVLRQQGNPYMMVLGLTDYVAPISLFEGRRFPEDVDLSLAGVDVGEFYYASSDYSTDLDSRITSISMRTVPEPSSVALVGLGGLLFLGGARGGPRRLWNSAQPSDACL